MSIDLSSDGEIEELFTGTNFGQQGKTPQGRRGLLVECVLKSACGYSSGFTICCICNDAGLLTQRHNPTKAGMRWAFEQIYVSGKTIIERITK